MTSSTLPKLLIVDDDKALTDLLSEFMWNHGFELIAENDPRNTITAIKSVRPKLLILDVMMPHRDGLTVLKTLRTESEMPVLMLTARGEAVDRILGLELGADDYISKPFEPRELIARIKAILKRSTLSKHELIVSGDLEIDPTQRRIKICGKAIDFTSMEYDLLHLLVTNPGRKFSRDQLLTEIHETETESYGRAIDNLVNRVRRKIESVSDSGCIKTIWGTGYMYTEQTKNKPE